MTCSPSGEEEEENGSGRVNVTPTVLHDKLFALQLIRRFVYEYVSLVYNLKEAAA